LAWVRHKRLAGGVFLRGRTKVVVEHELVRLQAGCLEPERVRERRRPARLHDRWVPERVAAALVAVPPAGVEG
jgi:hypothetical protein